MPGFVPFFDRATELDQLRAWVANAEGPVTIHGPCGSGKTSLARRLSSEARSRWAWCDLRRARDVGEARLSLADAIGLSVPETTSLSGSPGFTRRLGQRFHGVVLDAAEHLVDAGGRFPAWVEALAWAVPVVVTSTSRLRVSTEHVIPLWGLPPDAAAELFTHHVRRVHPEFPVEAADAKVHELLEALDRLPLAIVLAAERLEVLGLEELLGKVRDGSDWMGALHGRATPSHWLEEAWERLDPSLRHVAVQLAVFVGAFHMEDVEAIVRTPDGAPPPVAALATLADRALIRGVGTPTMGRRLCLSAPVRRFLRARPLWSDLCDTVKERHARWYACGKLAGTDAILVTAPSYELADLVAASAEVARRDESAAAWARVIAAASGFTGESKTLVLLSEEALRARDRGDMDVFARAVITGGGLAAAWSSVPAAEAILALALEQEERVSPGARAMILATAALFEELQDHGGPARARARRARETLSNDMSPTSRAEALVQLSTYHQFGGRIDEALEAIREAGSYAAEPWTRAFQLGTQVVIEAEAGVASTVSKAELARCLPYSLPMFPAWTVMGRVLSRHGERPSLEILEALEAAAREAEQHGSRHFRYWMDAHRGWLLWDLGDRDRGIATTQVAIEGLQQMGAVSTAVPPALAMSWWLMVEGRGAEGRRWWQWATRTESASAPLGRALRAVFGSAHPDLDPGGAEVGPSQARWARVRIARAMVAREVQVPTTTAPVELLEPSEGEGGLARRNGNTVRVSTPQYALLQQLVERWVEDEGLLPAVRGYASSAVLLATLPFDIPYPEHRHVKQLVRRTRERLEPLGVDIEGRQGFGYRLKLGDQG